tara:strand:+ start:13458 stop:13784 length:327 start_codon:yes stop_codon:yes gene_type:complete
MIVVVNKFLLAKGFKGISLWPFVIVKDESCKNDVILINHEKIHLQQQAELLVLVFYLWYGIEFLVRWFQLNNRKLAYCNISFEKEAYENELDIEYIKSRPRWNFMKYL